MNDFLQQLLEHELDNRHLDFRQAPGYQERLERISACHDQIRSSLGLDFLDRLNDLEGEMSDYERLACFRHGFRLAAFPWNCCLEQRADVGIRPYRRGAGRRPQGSPLRAGAVRRFVGRPLWPPVSSEPQGPEREYPRQRAMGIRPCGRQGRPARAPPCVWAVRRPL
ncbi:MAG: DUF6809 family protein [Flavonifractor plautii]